MGNDFLDSYKKKADSEFGGASNAPPPTVSEPVTPPAVSNNKPTVPDSKPVVPDSKPAGANPVSDATPPVAQPQTKGMSYEQQNSFKKPVYNHTPSPSNQQQKKKLPIKYIVIGIVSVIAIIILILIFSGGTAVPSMVGWSQSDAELWGRENEVLLRITEEYFDNVPADEVVEQTPPEGQEVSAGDFIELVVSLGPDPEVEILIPDIMNMTMQEVEDWAEQNYMTAVRIVTEESSTVPVGKAIEFSVNDNTVLGDTIKRNTPFYVVFSKGEGEGEAVKIPNFLSMSLTEAQKFATDNSIVLEISEIFHETIASGQIISQSIKADETIYSGDSVELEISKGKEVLVPNFFLYDQERGAAEAVKLGITLVVKERYGDAEEGDLLSQSVRAGSLYEDGDVIELVYSLGDGIVVQSFVGKNESEIRTWIEPFNKLGASLSVNTTYSSSDKAAGTVLSQDKVDYTLKYNGSFSIVVSKGPIIYVPDFSTSTGTTYADIITREKAIITCEALGIVPIFVEEANSSRLPGEVWHQSIAIGTEVLHGSTITLKYNPVAGTKTVPNFVTDPTLNTKQLIEVSAWMKEFSITFVEQEDPRVTDPADPNFPEYTVLSQSIPAGAQAGPSSQLIITVAVEPIPVPAP